MSSLSPVIERKARRLKEKTASGDLLNTRPQGREKECLIVDALPSQ